MRVFFLLPAYNEEESFPPLFAKIEQAMTGAGHDFTIVVCDDGSRDRTSEVLASYAGKLPLVVLTHKINRGLGETVRDLFEYAVEQAADDDVIIRMDCDDTHDPAIALAMLAHLDTHPEIGVVIASRFQDGGGQVGLDGYRMFVSRAANGFMGLFFPVKGVREYSCGYRAYRALLMKQAIAAWGNGLIQIKGLGFTCTLEKLVKLWLLGAKFAEVPFVLRYDQKRSTSKMISSLTTLGYLVMLVTCYWPFGGWITKAAERRRQVQQFDLARAG